MQNPFTTTFSKTPEHTYVTTDETDEILDNFSYQKPSESVYKITGVRGSGKTVLLAKIEEELRQQDNWYVFDLNPTRDMLKQIASMLNSKIGAKSGKKSKITGVSATVLGTGGGFSVSSENNENLFDIGNEIDDMLIELQKKNIKILVGIDEVSKTQQMIEFTSEYGRWLRADYPVYLVCTGLYENISELSNVKNLTFFRRSTTVQTNSLNTIRMAEMYRKQLNVGTSTSIEMAKITKGYAYAFQELGVLYFRKQSNQTLSDLIPLLKTELFSYSYEKIWEELTDGDRYFVKTLTEDREYKRSEIIDSLGSWSGNYSMYRDRLLKRGLLKQRQGYVSSALPFFSDYVRDYC